MQSSSSSLVLSKTHKKLLAFDLQSLIQTAGTPSSLPQMVLGTVTFSEHKPNRFLKFAVYDRAGCIPCVLWLNHLNSPLSGGREPRDVQLIADMSADQTSKVRIGAVVRVHSRITNFRGEVQISDSDVVAKTDPATEILQWLARRVYDWVHTTSLVILASSFNSYTLTNQEANNAN